MVKRRISLWIILAGVFILVGLAAFYKSEFFNSASEIRQLKHGLTVEIADTSLTRAQGLSGRLSLPEDTGLLFIFNRKGRHGIWMKDMNFAIDILWLDSSYRVVDIKMKAQPESWPAIFQPSQPANYVLEVNAGWVKRFGVKIGDELL